MKPAIGRVAIAVSRDQRAGNFRENDRVGSQPCHRGNRASDSGAEQEYECEAEPGFEFHRTGSQ